MPRIPDAKTRRWRVSTHGWIASASISVIAVAGCVSHQATNATPPSGSGLGGSLSDAKALFPQVAKWSDQGSQLTGEDSTPGLAQVLLVGKPTDLTRLLVSVVLSNDLSQTQVNTAVAYLHEAGELAAGQQGSSWVGQEISDANSGGVLQSLNSSTTIGSVILRFSAGDIANLPTMTVSADPK